MISCIQIVVVFSGNVRPDARQISKQLSFRHHFAGFVQRGSVAQSNAISRVQIAHELCTERDVKARMQSLRR
jgi:hypothetical protein